MDKDRNVFSSYLEEIGKMKPLPQEEQQRLAERIQVGDRRALDRLVQTNLTFVVSLAKEYRDKGLEMEDLVSEGNIGMMRAAEKYDGRDGKSFVTFAAPFIRQAMEKAIEDQSLLYRIPADAKNPSQDRWTGKALSMDAPVGGSQELSLGRVVADKNAIIPDEALAHQLIEEELLPLVRTLEPRQQHVLRRFYGLGAEQRTLAEIGQEMGLKRERVRQIRNAGLRKVLKQCRDAHLKTYLMR